MSSAPLQMMVTSPTRMPGKDALWNVAESPFCSVIENGGNRPSERERRQRRYDRGRSWENEAPRVARDDVTRRCRVAGAG
jgi:hypothetical protein